MWWRAQRRASLASVSTAAVIAAARSTDAAVLPARELVQVRGHERREHWTTRPDGDAGPEPDPLRPGGDRGQRHERLALDLDMPSAVQPGVLHRHAELDHVVERHALAREEQADV